MQVGFPIDKKIALVGQKVDATPCTVISATAVGDIAVSFGALLVYDDSEANLCKLPTAKSHLDKPLGIALRQFHGHDYQPKSQIAAMRQGRVWVKCNDDVAPADPVYVAVGPGGAHFTVKSTEGSVKLKGAIYLEKAQGGLAPIEINFLGGAQ